MKEYELIWWAINEEKNAPLGADHYYPLMKKIIIRNEYINKEYMKDSALTFFNYVIRKTCKDMDSLELYYQQTLIVLGQFDKLYQEDKNKTMNMNAEEFIKLIKESEK